MLEKSKITLVIAIVLCIAMTQSCKRGCTDPKAINYVKGAKQDDASCLYCDSSIGSTGITVNNFIIDRNSSSSHFDQEVIQYTVSENQFAYSGNACQILGKGNASCPSTLIFTGTLTNMTNSNILLSGPFQINLFGSSSSSINYQFNSLYIPAGGTDTVTFASNICNIPLSFDAEILNSSIQYH